MALSTNVRIEHGPIRILASALMAIFLMPIHCADATLSSTHPEAVFRIKLFGCELPIPVSYAINGRELNRIVMSRDTGEIGGIVISKFVGYSEMYEVSGETKVGHLTVADLVHHREWGKPDYDMTIIRDDENIVALLGAARALKSSLVEACVSQKK